MKKKIFVLLFAIFIVFISSCNNTTPGNPDDGDGSDINPTPPEEQIEEDLVSDKFNEVLTALPTVPLRGKYEGYTREEVKSYMDFIKGIRDLNDESLKIWAEQQVKLPADYPTDSSSISKVDSEIITLLTELQELTNYSTYVTYNLSSIYSNDALIAFNAYILDDSVQTKALPSNALDLSYLMSNFPSTYDEGSNTFEYKHYLKETWVIKMVGGDSSNYTYKEGSEAEAAIGFAFDQESFLFSSFPLYDLINSAQFSSTYENTTVNGQKIVVNETDTYYYYEFPDLYNGISEIFVVNDEICYIYGTEYNGYYSL